jgi:anti-sigma B factor antagonist
MVVPQERDGIGAAMAELHESRYRRRPQRVSATADDRIETGILALHVGERNGVLRIEALGELDLAGAPALARQLALALQSPATEVRLDLGRLEFIDSSGLREIVRAHCECDRSGRRFRVVRGSGQVAQVMNLTGLDEVFHFAD